MSRFVTVLGALALVFLLTLLLREAVSPPAIVQTDGKERFVMNLVGSTNVQLPPTDALSRAIPKGKHLFVYLTSRCSSCSNDTLIAAEKPHPDAPLLIMVVADSPKAFTVPAKKVAPNYRIVFDQKKKLFRDEIYAYSPMLLEVDEKGNVLRSRRVSLTTSNDAARLIEVKS